MQPYGSFSNLLNLVLCDCCPAAVLSAQCCCPPFKEEVDELERSQRRASRMVKGLENLPDSDRLSSSSLNSITERGLSGDLIKAYKDLHMEQQFSLRAL